tara:strand:+ start:4350 stop:5210 length:861 start_codon:yes stop_codon:yes gene_type:complete
MNIWDKLQSIDRRWIFLVMFIVIIIPLMNPKSLDINVSEPTRKAFQRIEDVPSDSNVLISWDFDPGSQAELLPTAKAMLHQLFKKDVNIVVITLWPAAPTLADTTLNEISSIYNKEEGVDWVNLGFKPGLDIVVKSMGSDIYEIFPADDKGRRVESIPLMKNIRNYDDFNLVIDLSAGSSVDFYVEQANGRYGADLVAAATGVMIGDFYPYLEANQLQGLVGALVGAAEYEKLMEQSYGLEPDKATAGMQAQAKAHMAIIIFIILGNIGFFAKRKKSSPKLESLNK